MKNWKPILVTSIGLIIGGIVTRGLTPFFSGEPRLRNQSIHQQLEIAAEIANKKAGTTLDGDTRFDSMLVDSNDMVVYKYTLLKKYANNVDKEFFYNEFSLEITRRACLTESTRGLLDTGVIFVYDYFGKDGLSVGEIVVGKAACAIGSPPRLDEAKLNKGALIPEWAKSPSNDEDQYRYVSRSIEEVSSRFLSNSSASLALRIARERNENLNKQIWLLYPSGETSLSSVSATQRYDEGAKTVEFGLLYRYVVSGFDDSKGVEVQRADVAKFNEDACSNTSVLQALDERLAVNFQFISPSGRVLSSFSVSARTCI